MFVEAMNILQLSVKPAVFVEAMNILQLSTSRLNVPYKESQTRNLIRDFFFWGADKVLSRFRYI